MSPVSTLVNVSFYHHPYYHCNTIIIFNYQGKKIQLTERRSFDILSLNLMRGNALMLASQAPDVDIPRAEVDGVQ